MTSNEVTCAAVYFLIGYVNLKTNRPIGMEDLDAGPAALHKHPKLKRLFTLLVQTSYVVAWPAWEFGYLMYTRSVERHQRETEAVFRVLLTHGQGLTVSDIADKSDGALCERTARRVVDDMLLDGHLRSVVNEDLFTEYRISPMGYMEAGSRKRGTL